MMTVDQVLDQVLSSDDESGLGDDYDAHSDLESESDGGIVNTVVSDHDTECRRSPCSCSCW